MLNGAQLAVLKTELRDARYTDLLALQDYEAIAAVLNDRPMIANPVPRPNVRLAFTWGTFIDLLAEAEVLGLYQYGALAADLRQALEMDNRTELLALWRAAKTKLTAATIAKVEAEFGKTRPDPNWTATVPGDSLATALGLPRVEARDVQAISNV